MSEERISVKSRRRARGSGNGRAKTVAALNRLVAKKTNQKVLIAALQAKFNEDPLRFFRTVVMPLLPRNVTLSDDCSGVMEWRSLPGSYPPVGRKEEVKP